MSQNKELISILNTLENQCETFYKQLDIETEKAGHNFHKNPKHLDLLMTNLTVDIEQSLNRLKELDSIFYQQIKGDLTSYEKTALQLIGSYKIVPVDSSETLAFLKTIQDKKDELRSLLDLIFQKVQKHFLI